MDDLTVITWEPFRAEGSRLRITETSCCGVYEWACQGGQYLVLRGAENGYEETGRGIHSQARQVWNQLAFQHQFKERAPLTWLGLRDSLP
jgi:hypothetical protein